VPTGGGTALDDDGTNAAATGSRRERWRPDGCGASHGGRGEQRLAPRGHGRGVVLEPWRRAGTPASQDHKLLQHLRGKRSTGSMRRDADAGAWIAVAAHRWRTQRGGLHIRPAGDRMSPGAAARVKHVESVARCRSRGGGVLRPGRHRRRWRRHAASPGRRANNLSGRQDYIGMNSCFLRVESKTGKE
jgi:hypothetical protein